MDPSRSDVAFAVKHMMLTTLNGHFKEFEGSLEVTADGAARAVGTVNPASIDTDETVRDERLRRSREFFNAERFPEITFESTSIERANGGFRVRGELTMRGITNPVELEARARRPEDGADAERRVALVLHGRLSRRQFGITWNETLDKGGALVGDTVKMTLQISAVQVNGASNPDP